MDKQFFRTLLELGDRSYHADNWWGSSQAFRALVLHNPRASFSAVGRTDAFTASVKDVLLAVMNKDLMSERHYST